MSNLAGFAFTVIYRHCAGKLRQVERGARLGRRCWSGARVLRAADGAEKPGSDGAAGVAPAAGGDAVLRWRAVSRSRRRAPGAAVCVQATWDV